MFGVKLGRVFFTHLKKKVADYFVQTIIMEYEIEVYERNVDI